MARLSPSRPPTASHTVRIVAAGLFDRGAAPSIAKENAVVKTISTVPALTWHSGAAVTVVIAAEDYPEAPAKGDAITFTDIPEGTEGYFLHAGTALNGTDLVTAGGRVLNAVGSGPDLAAARAAAYAVAACAEFRGAWYRNDIAERAAADA